MARLTKEVADVRSVGTTILPVVTHAMTYQKYRYPVQSRLLWH